MDSDYFVLVMKKRQLCLQLSPISVQILELWIPQTTEIVVLKCWMQQELQATMQQCPQFHCLVKSIRTFCQSWDLSLSFLNLMFSRLSRGPSGPNHWCHCSLLPDLSWELESNMLKFHTLGWFFFYVSMQAKTLSSISYTYVCHIIRKGNNMALVPVTLSVPEFLREIFCWPTKTNSKT